MDPLTALGLASNVIQVVDFSIKIVSKGRQIYKSADGALVETVDLEAVTTNFTIINEKLRKSMPVGLGSPLLDVCQRCQNTADELLMGLEKQKIQGNKTKWKSARAALRTLWSKEVVEDLEVRLESLQAQLRTHLLFEIS
jgi:hypothetical protein